MIVAWPKQGPQQRFMSEPVATTSEPLVQAEVAKQPPKIKAKDVDFFYGAFQALHKVNLDLQANKVTALIGPSGCGKSTFLRCLNRMNDLIDGARMEGTITIDGEDIYSAGVDPVELRKQVGMVFQKANPFPMSIFDNIAYGPRIHGVKKRDELEHIVEDCLKKAAL